MTERPLVGPEVEIWVPTNDADSPVRGHCGESRLVGSARRHEIIESVEVGGAAIAGIGEHEGSGGGHALHKGARRQGELRRDGLLD